MPLPEVERLVEVMARLRRECPWDAEQTHRSLVAHLVEETCETVEAIEAGDPDHLCEELGDLLLQVVFHAQIAAERPAGFDLERVAARIADKLVARHPYVFASADVPADLLASWERRKAVEKGRASALDGIPDRLSALTRAGKVISRARSHGVLPALPTTPVQPSELGAAVLDLVARAQSSGLDAEQVVRDAVRGLEAEIAAIEAAGGPSSGASAGEAGPAPH